MANNATAPSAVGKESMDIQRPSDPRMMSCFSMLGSKVNRTEFVTFQGADSAIPRRRHDDYETTSKFARASGQHRIVRAECKAVDWCSYRPSGYICYSDQTETCHSLYRPTRLFQMN
jgi:hypothetical protein